MLSVLAIIHVLIGLALVVFVLLQDPKDGAAGIFGGGSSSKSFFSASGASDFLSTTTKWLSVMFACTSLLLTGITSKRASSVLDQPDGAVPTAPAPGQPAAAPTAPATGAAPAPAAPAPAAPASDHK